MFGYTASKDGVNSMCCSVKLSGSSMQCTLMACLILNLINKWSTKRVYCQANKLCPSLIEKPSLPQLLCSPLWLFTLIPRQSLHFYSSSCLALLALLQKLLLTWKLAHLPFLFWQWCNVKVCTAAFDSFRKEKLSDCQWLSIRSCPFYATSKVKREH